MTSLPLSPQNPVSPETIQRYVGAEGITGPAHAAKLAVEAYNNQELPLSQFFAKIATDFSFAKALAAVDGDPTTISWKDLSQLDADNKGFIAKAAVGTVPELNQDTLSNLVALSKLRPVGSNQSVWDPYRSQVPQQPYYPQPQQQAYYPPPQQPYYPQPQQQAYYSPPQQPYYPQPQQQAYYPPPQQPYYPQPQQGGYPQDPMYAQNPQAYGGDPYANAGFGLNNSYQQMPNYSTPPSYNYYPVQPTPQPPIYNTYNYITNNYNTYNTTNNNQVYNNQAYNTYNNQAYNNQRYNMPMNYNQFNNSGNTVANMPFFNQQQTNMNQFQNNRLASPPIAYGGGMPNLMSNQYGGGSYNRPQAPQPIAYGGGYPQQGGMPNMMQSRPPMYGNSRMFPV